MMSHWQGWLYVAAVLIPLGAFTVEALFGRWLKRLNAYLATGAIGTCCVLSLIGLATALPTLLSGSHHAAAGAESEAAAHASIAESEVESEGDHATGHAGFAWTGQFDWVVLGEGITVNAPTPEQPAAILPGLAIPLAIHIDGLAVIMFTMVTFIATLIHIYSMGYMADDPRYPRFFTYLSLFCFSMLGLVASANVFMVFMFWELVGVCSYLLIGFWYEEKKNADAANKAFIVNRVGDIGMLIGLGLLWSYFGTFTIADINAGLSDPALREPVLHRMTYETATASSNAITDLVTVHLPDSAAGEGGAGLTETRTIPYNLLVLAGLGIFAGCVGKSAQFPLHVWLPDAMAGPTPVSALIHAATMVAAGVYLVGRFFPLFTHEVLLTIAYAGGITLFIAATIAMVQVDYKKVLAYSTVSQLGYMMLALGVGGWAAGLFHLLTHAFFKALLFLGAGSVYHSVHTYEMPVLGGLYKKMPRTALTMLAGTLAISGVPLFSGFYSKDAILASALHFTRHHPGQFLLFVLPAVGALITAFYMFRMWFLLFDGEPRGYPVRQDSAVEVEHGHFEAEDDHGHASAAAHGHGHDHGNPVEHAHESPGLMTWPLILLAIPAVVIGYPWWILPISTPVLEQMLETAEPFPAYDVGGVKWLAMGGSVLIAASGIAAAAGYYSRWKILNPKLMADRFGGLYRIFVNKWYFDELYNAVFVRPTLWLSRRVLGFDQQIVDGVVNGTANVTRETSRFEGFFDNFAVDGLVKLTALVVYGLGDWGRGLQTGRLRSYLGVLAVAVVALFLGMFLWIQPR